MYLSGNRDRGEGEGEGEITGGSGNVMSSRYNERNEGDGAAIKMMALCISHVT